jgi:hypothetical protein
MGKATRLTMAQIIEEVRTRPAAPADGDRWAPAPNTHTGSGLLSPDGRTFDRVQREIAPNDAVMLLRSGALVVWDACGCGGYCGFDWLGAARRNALLNADPPRIGGRARRAQWGSMSHWRCDDGTDLLLAANHVRWGQELA